MNGTNGVSVSKVAQIMDLYNFLPDMDLKKHRIKISDVNRPALQLSGFFEHFEQSRVQIIGNVEYTYLQRLDVEKKERQKGKDNGGENLARKDAIESISPWLRFAG